MNNSSIVIIQIKYTILQTLTKFAEYLKEESSFFELYNEDILCLISLPVFVRDYEMFIELSEKYRLDIQILQLNTFAKSRLISNFEDEYPELALKVMSCGKESKIIKVRELK